MTSITVPKPDKDTAITQNYRPIPLINIEVKIPKNVLASQIQVHIRRTIDHDQVGVTPEMQGWFSVNKLINVIHHSNIINDKNNDPLNK